MQIPEDLKAIHEHFSALLNCAPDCSIDASTVVGLIETIAELRAELHDMTVDRNLWQDDHNEECPHVAENAELRAEVERLKAPIHAMDEEWRAHSLSRQTLSANEFNAIIAARAASTKGEDNAEVDNRAV